MSAITTIDVDQLVGTLRLLCAHPSTSGHPYHINQSARVVADAMRVSGLEVKKIPTGGPPLLFGWRDGRRPFTLLLYHHYDTNPTGPWRTWFHDPFQVSERDDHLFGRGVAHGKGPLAAHLQAIRSILDTEHELPHGILMMAEGERLIGSPHLERVIRRNQGRVHVDACLSSGGEYDSAGRPFCYSGSKGLLRVRLKAYGADHPLPPGLAASVHNPVWRLAWALGEIKGADEDIRINGFYDSVEGPGRDERTILRQVQFDEERRKEAWGIPEFLFDMSGKTLVRTEVTLPTCNLSAFRADPINGMACIPMDASAQLDFQLVPQQNPEEIFDLLCKHLAARGFGDIGVERLPGGYAPVQSDIAQPFLQQLAQAGERVYGAPLTVLPLGTFAYPLHLFTHYLQTPVSVLAFANHGSTEYGANEHIPLANLVRHAQMLVEVMGADHPVVKEQAVALAEG